VTRAGRALVAVAVAGLALAGCRDAGPDAAVSQVESQLDAIQRDLDDVPG